jgi:hypothetical protein
MKTAKELRASIATLQTERTLIHKAMEPLEQQLTANIRKEERLQEQLGKLLAKGKKGKAPNWAVLVKSSHEGGMTLHKYAHKKFYEIGLYMSGHFPDTGDNCLQVMMTRNDKNSYKKTLNAVKLLVPFLTEKDGWVKFGIFEYSLSSSGSFYLLVSKDLTKAKIVHRRLVFEGSLEEVLTRIQEQYYYKDANDG